MTFTRPQDYVDALKELEGFPLMGMEIKDGRKPVAMFRLDQSTLNRKEMTFNVI